MGEHGDGHLTVAQGRLEFWRPDVNHRYFDRSRFGPPTDTSASGDTLTALVRLAGASTVNLRRAGA